MQEQAGILSADFLVTLGSVLFGLAVGALVVIVRYTRRTNISKAEIEN